MQKDWKYIAYLSAAILFYLTLKLLSPRELDWTITYHHNDKNPFGAFALDKFIPSLFPGSTVHHNNYTLYELYDTLQKPVNFLSISTSFSPGKEDTEALLNNIERGGSAFISAQYFSGDFADTLSLNTSDYFFENTNELFNRNDTTYLAFMNPALHSAPHYFFPRKNIHNYFADYDSTGTIVTMNDLDLPVTVKISRGKGFIYLNSTPLTFTNVYLLNGDNYGFAERSLSHLPNRETYWTEFYHLGRLEAQTPLRFILSNEPLRWAYFITVLSLLIFILFEAKRRQKIIPIRKPLSNTSLEFVNTIGSLYYQSNDHKNIAEKRIRFFLEQARSMYGVLIHTDNEESMQTLARKSGNPNEVVQELFTAIRSIHNKENITADELKDLNNKIDRFNHL